MVDEEWRDVVGYEGYYQVSNLGKVRSSRKFHKTYPGRLLKPIPSQTGRAYVLLQRDCVRSPRVVARLVAEAFIGPIPEKLDVDHIDGDYTNNAAANLQFLTRSENILKSYRSGAHRAMIGEKHPCAQVSEDIAREILTAHSNGEGGYKRLGVRFGVSWNLVRKIATGQTWKHIRGVVQCSP